MDKFTERMNAIAKSAIDSSIWRPASVSSEPETTLIAWRVFRVTNLSASESETYHFCGRTSYGEGRVCSPIQSYDPTTRRAVTRSGRVYELVGESGHDKDAIYVWKKWLAINDDPEFFDVTDSFENQPRTS
jgi:hypothetical protein